MRGRGRPGPVLIIAAVCGAAAAQEPVQLEPMQVTASRSAAPATSLSRAVTVIEREQIEREAPQTWTDLLRAQPGAFVQSSGPGQGIVIVRGLKGSEVLHLVDGMRLNNSFFRNSPSQYIALVDPHNLARIELLRGPGATLWGSDAMGGVVQLLTPEYRFAGDGPQAAGALRLQYGSADLSRVLRSELAAGTRRLALSGGFTFMDYGERDLGGSGREDLTDYLARGYDAKLLWTPDEAHELMVSGQSFEYPRLARYFDVAGGPGGAGGDLASYFEPNARQFVHARYRYLGALGPVQRFEAHLARQIIDDDRRRQPNASRIDTEQNRSTLDGLTVQAQTALPGNLLLRYGADWYADRIDSARQRSVPASGQTSDTVSTFPDGAQQDSLGVYLHGEWMATPRWQLDGGLRYSHVDTDLPATAVSAASRFDDEDLTWQLGSRFALTPAWSWTASAARGFRAPNIFDLGTLGPRPAGASEQVNVPNPALQPETVTTLDSGLHWRSGIWRAEATAFWSDYADRIEAREPTGNTVASGELGCSDAGGCVEVQSRNIASARYWGVEAAAGLQADAVDIHAVLNWTWGQERRDGAATTPANRIPPLNGRLGARLALPRAWTLEPYLLFAGPQRRLDDDDRNDTRIDPDGTGGWITANLRLAWQLRGWLQLQLDGRNLFDADYREHGSGIDAPGAGVVLSAAARW